MADWPLTLPQNFRAEGLEEEEPDNALETPMDAGPPKRRLRTVSNVGRLAGVMVMTSAQYDTLRTFFRDTVKQVEPFNFPKQGGEAGKISVVFKRPISRNYYKPGLWRVPLELEVQP